MDELPGSDSEDGSFEHYLSDGEEGLPEFQEEIEEENREEEEVPAPPDPAALGILPYQFEPVFPVGEIEEDEDLVVVLDNQEDLEIIFGENDV